VNLRATQLLIALAVAGGVSCIDMSAPSGAASISTLQSPAAFVVRGDSMRDSAGKAAPLSVTAFDQNGNPVSGVQFQFFITDTGKIATISPGNIVVANDTTGLVHVVGQTGGIQTPAVTIFVTDAPNQIVSAVLPTDTLQVTGAADTTAGRGTKAAPARVFAADGHTPIQGMVVHFSIMHTPDTTASTSKAPRAVYLLDDNQKLSSIDTTDASGQAARTVVVIASRLANPNQPDSVVVLATATYRGVPLANAPVPIKIPVKLVF